MSTHATIRFTEGRHIAARVHVRADGYPDSIEPVVNSWWRNLCAPEMDPAEVLALRFVDHHNREENLVTAYGRCAPLAQLDDREDGSYVYSVDCSTGKLYIQVSDTRWALLATLDTEPEVKPWEPEGLYTFKTLHGTVTL